MTLQEIRFYWLNGMKYTAIPTLLLSVFTFIGVWLKALGFFVNGIIIILVFLAYLLLIYILGILDYTYGYMAKDVEKSEKLSPMWIEQTKHNNKVLLELKKLREELKNVECNTRGI